MGQGPNIKVDSLARAIEALQPAQREEVGSIVKLLDLFNSTSSVFDRTNLVAQMLCAVDQATATDQATRSTGTNQYLDRGLIKLALSSASLGPAAIQFPHGLGYQRYYASQICDQQLHVLVLKDGAQLQDNIKVLADFSSELLKQRPGMTIQSVRFVEPYEGIDPGIGNPAALIVSLTDKKQLDAFAGLLGPGK